MKSETSARITLWVNRLIAAFLLVLILLMPRILDYYGRMWAMPASVQTKITVAYYLCLVLILPALWNIDCLLGSILKKQVFIPENVTRIRHVCWCCMGVGLICIPAANFFTPLYFLAVIMLFLAFIVNVIKDVIAAAVEIREENDLTV